MPQGPDRICFRCVRHEQKIPSDVHEGEHGRNSVQRKKFRMPAANHTSANNACKEATRFHFKSHLSKEPCMQGAFLRATALEIVMYLSTSFSSQQNCSFLLQTIFILLGLNILRNEAREFKDFKVPRALIVSLVIASQ